MSRSSTVRGFTPLSRSPSGLVPGRGKLTRGPYGLRRRFKLRYTDFMWVKKSLRRGPTRPLEPSLCRDCRAGTLLLRQVQHSSCRRAGDKSLHSPPSSNRGDPGRKPVRASEPVVTTYRVSFDPRGRHSTVFTTGGVSHWYSWSVSLHTFPSDQCLCTCLVR